MILMRCQRKKYVFRENTFSCFVEEFDNTSCCYTLLCISIIFPHILKYCCRPPDKSVILKIFFLISQQKLMLWILKRTVSLKYPKSIFKTDG